MPAKARALFSWCGKLPATRGPGTSGGPWEEVLKMINGVRGSVCVAVVCLAACGGGNGTVAGKVTFSDASDAAGLRVTLLGLVGKRVDTGAGGAYSFDKLPQGVYQLSVEAADTRERRLSFGLESDGSTAVMVPDLVFSPVGSLTGKVINAAGPAAGVTVYLSGSDRVALTDAAGSYGFVDVPAGDYAVVAKASGALPQTASAMVKIKRGKQEAMPLTLGNDLTVTGKLEGTVALFNGASPKDITVSVADVVAMTNDTGRFSLTLPPGQYDVLAELAGYPKQSLGFATVRAGLTTTLPVKTLTLFKALAWGSAVPTFSQPFWLAVSESDIAVLQVPVDTDYSNEYYFFDTKTFERKLVAIGNISRQSLSKNGKWLAFTPSSGKGVVAVNSATGQTHSVPAANVTAGPVISNDEATLMFFAGSPQNSLVRVDLNTGVSTSFPAFSPSYFQSNERFLARSTVTAPFDVQLITPTTATTVFNNMQVLSNNLFFQISPSTFGYQVLYAYSCPALGNCTVQVLGPTATSSSAVTAGISSAPSTINGSVREWLGLEWFGGPTPGKVLVKVADATTTLLPATTSNLLFNETMARVATYSTGGLGYEVREDVVPPNAMSTVHLTTPGFPTGAWLSPTRFMVFGTGPTKRVDLKAGAASSDTDVTVDGVANSPSFFPPGVLWVKGSTSKRVAAVYDSADLAPDTLGITGSFNFGNTVGSRASVVSPLLGKFAGFSDGVSAYVLDGVKSEVRKVGVGFPTSNFGLFIPTDRMKVQRLGGTELQFFESGRLVSLSEPGQSLNGSGGVASLPKGGTIAVAVKSTEPRNILYFGVVP